MNLTRGQISTMVQTISHRYQKEKEMYDNAKDGKGGNKPAKPLTEKDFHKFNVVRK